MEPGGAYQPPTLADLIKSYVEARTRAPTPVDSEDEPAPPEEVAS